MHASFYISVSLLDTFIKKETPSLLLALKCLNLTTEAILSETVQFKAVRYSFFIVMLVILLILLAMKHIKIYCT